MPVINLMNNSSTFAETEVRSTTVGALRSELDLGNADINVDRRVAGDDHPIEDDSNVADVSRDKKGGVRKTKKRKSRQTVDPHLKNEILLDVEAGTPVALVSKEYGVGISTIHRWRKESKGHRTLKNARSLGKMSSSILSKNGTLVVSEKTTTPKVTEVKLHLSQTYVPGSGQLRITRELLDYLNEVGAHLTK